MRNRFADALHLAQRQFAAIGAERLSRGEITGLGLPEMEGREAGIPDALNPPGRSER